MVRINPCGEIKGIRAQESDKCDLVRAGIELVHTRAEVQVV